MIGVGFHRACAAVQAAAAFLFGVLGGREASLEALAWACLAAGLSVAHGLRARALERWAP